MLPLERYIKVKVRLNHYYFADITGLNNLSCLFNSGKIESKRHPAALHRSLARHTSPRHQRRSSPIFSHRTCFPASIAIRLCCFASHQVCPRRQYPHRLTPSYSTFPNALLTPYALAKLCAVSRSASRLQK